MPYIPLSERRRVEMHGPASPGGLNYAITQVINSYIGLRGLSYQTINDVIGVLECAKLEAYRRIAVDYEDQKREENGDVY